MTPDELRTHDITGERFGHLTAIRFDHKGKYRTYWLCRCDCGKECFVSRQNLTSGKTQSCGHLLLRRLYGLYGHLPRRTKE